MKNTNNNGKRPYLLGLYLSGISVSLAMVNLTLVWPIDPLYLQKKNLILIFCSEMLLNVSFLQLISSYNYIVYSGNHMKYIGEKIFYTLIYDDLR